jgi:hypothetical protein
MMMRLRRAFYSQRLLRVVSFGDFTSERRRNLFSSLELEFTLSSQESSLALEERKDNNENARVQNLGHQTNK